MINIIFSELSTILGRGLNSVVDIEVTETPTITDAVTTFGVKDDINFKQEDSEGAVITFKIDVLDLLATGIFFISEDESIATVDDTGQVFYVSDGTASILIGTNTHEERRETGRRLASGVVTLFTPLSFVVGTVGAHCQAALETLVNGRPQSNLLQELYLTNTSDVDNPDVTVNPNFFAPSLDFSGVSIARTGLNEDTFPVALVTDRHAIIARHVAPAAGTKVAFRRQNGTYQTATVLDRTHVEAGGIVGYIDLSVIYFDQVITGTTIYKTLSDTFFQTYAPAAIFELFGSIYTESKSAFPSIRKARHASDGSGGSYVQLNACNRYFESNGLLNNTDPMLSPLQDWGIPGIGGDSGGPSFFLINNEMILATSQYTVTGGFSISGHVIEINTIMNDQAGVAQGTYELQHPDLSGFTTYV